MDGAGSVVRYNAPGAASTEIVEAECQGVRHRIVLTVIEPEFSAPDLKVARGSGPPPENNPVVAELLWMPYYGPSSVNFYRAKTCESGAPSEGATGYFVTHPVNPHPPNSCRLEETVVPGKGNPQYGQGDWLGDRGGMGVIVKLVGPDRGRTDWGRRALVGFFLLGGPSMAAVATEETPEAKVGWVEKEVAAAIEEFRRTDDPTVLEDRGDAAIMRGADNRVVRSPSARARLWNSAIALWLEAWQARPYKDVVRDDEKSEDLKEFFADSSPEGPEKWARREALRAKAIRDGQLRRVCGLIQSELGSQYGVLYGFDGGSHAKEFMGELERLWAGRPWFAVFSTNVVKDVELKFGSERPAGPAAGKEK